MLNPILCTERVVQDFLRYQLTAYPFADKALYAQMRKLLNLDETRQSPLLRARCQASFFTAKGGGLLQLPFPNAKRAGEVADG